MFRDLWETALSVFIAVAMGAAIFFGGNAVLDDSPPPPSPVAKLVSKTGHGSAVHIGDGFFLTVAHNLTGDQLPHLIFDDGSESELAVMWKNEEYDVALLHVDETDHVEAAPLSCRALDKGEAVTARGNPQMLEFVTIGGRVAGSEFSYGNRPSLVPIDITVSSGMSGGPIIADRGRVVGLISGFMTNLSAGTPMAIDIGFAVPSTAICHLMGRA